VGFADLDRFDSLQSPVAHDDNLWRGEFPPRQANSGLVEDPGLRRAASMIAVIAGIAQGIGKSKPTTEASRTVRHEDRKHRRDRTRPGKQDLAGLDALLLRQTRTALCQKGAIRPYPCLRPT
jgi:hypothetical protein